MDVDRVFRYVEVTAQDDRFASLLLKALQVSVEILVPLIDTVAQSTEIIFRIRHISHYEGKRVKFSCDRSTFFDMLIAEVILNIKRLDFREDSSARVPLTCRTTVPILGVACRDVRIEELLVNFFDGSLSLVEAHHRRIVPLHKLLKVAPLHDSVNPVYVPAPQVTGASLRKLAVNRALASFHLMGEPAAESAERQAGKLLHFNHLV